VAGDEARRRLVDAFPEEREAWKALDASFFPGYVEIGLDPDAADEATYRRLVSRVGALEIVDEVETHGDWYAKVLAIHNAARLLAVALGSLVVFATVFIVSHTIRLNFHRRRRQVEVMRMCGATPWFVRMPFLLEGALGTTLAAAVALGAIAVFVEALRDRIVDVAPVLGGAPIEHLPVAVWGAFLAVAAAVGFTGAYVSVRGALKG
jgi:cell division transport system permease protein